MLEPNENIHDARGAISTATTISKNTIVRPPNDEAMPSRSCTASPTTHTPIVFQIPQ